MRFRFPDEEVAIGVDLALGEPEGLDVVALREGPVLIILGLDDHQILAPSIISACEAAGGTRIPDEPGDA